MAPRTAATVEIVRRMAVKAVVVIKALIQLGRLNMAPLTMSVPVLGALSASKATVDLFWLGLIGLSAHIFGFALNDIIDQPVDSATYKRRRHPLRTGRLSYRTAWYITLVQIPIALGTYLLILGGNSIGFSLLCLSIGASVVYNLWSKRGFFPRLGAEVGLAVSVGLLCWSGAVWEAEKLSLESAIFALDVTLILLLLNSVPSGLKDIKTDTISGSQSFVLMTGSKVNEDELLISSTLRRYVWVIQVLLLGSLGISVFLFRPAWLIIGFMGLLIAYAIYHLQMILSLSSYKRMLSSEPLLSGTYNYAAWGLLVFANMPLWMQFLFAILILQLLLVPVRLSVQRWQHRYKMMLYR